MQRTTTKPVRTQTVKVDLGEGVYEMTDTYQYEVTTRVSVAEKQAQATRLQQEILDLPKDAKPR